MSDAEDERNDPWDAERQRREAAEAALAVQDHDFHAYGVYVCFYFNRHEGTGGDRPAADWRLLDWDSEDAEGTALPDIAVPEIINAISPSLDHFSTIGFLRADGLEGALIGGLEIPTSQPTFYIVCAADAATEVASLGECEPVSVAIGALPGMSLTIRYYARPINATRLFEATRDSTAQVGPWGGGAGTIASPEKGESREQFLARAALGADRAERLVERWRLSGGDLELFGMLGSAEERASGNQKIEWLGPFPRGCVTLLVGTNASGKSSFAHEIVAALGSSDTHAPRTILGVEVTGGHAMALISGEDSEGVINHRAASHPAIWGRPTYFVIDGVGKSFEDILELIERTPGIAGLIVDPVRAQLDGDEDSSSVVSKFYDRLTRIARAKNCAVIAVHHLTKGRPRRLSDMLPMVRGSGVHTDRARLVIGMIYRGNDVVEIGPIKCNLPGLWADVNVGELYKRDAATFTLKPAIVAAAQSPRGSDDESDAAAILVLAAVTNQNKARIVTRKTGRSGLFEARLPALVGLSRSAILTAISSLIEAGKIHDDGENGLVVVATPNPSSEAS